MRSLTFSVTVLAIAALATPACASSPDDKPIDQQSIAALQARIPGAQPREQCFLYAELIHQMTEFSMKQYAAGDTDKAKEKDDQHLAGRVMLQEAEVDDHDGADQHPENKDEFSLGQQVGFTSFVDEF